MKGTKSKKLTGVVGEYCVAYKLSTLGTIVALPRENSPSFDILSSNQSGSRQLAIQLKTTDWATREKGR